MNAYLCLNLVCLFVCFIKIISMHFSFLIFLLIVNMNLISLFPVIEIPIIVHTLFNYLQRNEETKLRWLSSWRRDFLKDF